jgi:CRP/FNR family transcriptional regulator
MALLCGSRVGEARSVSGSCFAEVLGVLVDLTRVETMALERLEERQRHVRRGAVLQRENEACGEIFILRKGLMMSYVLLDDGSRQILRFLFPGDMLGISSAIYREAPETLAALSDCVVSPFDRAALSDLMVAHPRLSAMILVYSQIERVALTDRLAALGRTSAKARVAALMLELRNRLRATDKSVANAFALGLTQEEIGDATGLTAVHVNRMLRQLEEEGMIAREGGRVTLLDERALARAANYVNRYEGLDLGWLPRPNP